MTWFVLRKFAVLLAIVLVTAVLVWWLLAGVPKSTVQGDFSSWLGHLLVGNFGLSQAGEAIGPMLGARLAVTLPLALLAMLLGTAVGSGIGWLAALAPGSVADRALTGLSDLGLATPNFWLGMMLAMAFASGLHWLPPGGFVPWQQGPLAALASLVLPAMALAAPAAAALAQQVRSTLADAASAPAVLGAQVRGATRRDAVRRSRGRALLTFGSPLARQFAAVVAGTVVVENVFYLPGLGRLILDAVSTRDLATLRGGLLVLVLMSAGIVFLIEIAFAWLDPRRRAGVPE